MMINISSRKILTPNKYMYMTKKYLITWPRYRNVFYISFREGVSSHNKIMAYLLLLFPISISIEKTYVLI